MCNNFNKAKWIVVLLAMVQTAAQAQITLIKDYQLKSSATIGTFQGISFKEGGFSGLFPVRNTNSKEFWTLSDRGVNVDAANANTASCRPTYDKIYGFPTYAPKLHRIRLKGDSIQILQTLSIRRPNGTTATGLLNPTGFGSTATEEASIDTVMNCANFTTKRVSKDVFGIDSEGIFQDPQGNFWICEEGGPTIWKLNRNGVLIKRYTPYANLVGAEPVDAAIDTVFKYRKNNRGFEGLTMTPNGKIYAIIQSPILFPSKSAGENTRVHRILELNPSNGQTRMLAYLNDGAIGSGADQIRLRDWKISDMAAINDSTFLVIEAGLRGATDRKNIYTININKATAITAALYGGKTLEELSDSAGLASQGIVPVKKKLFMNMLNNGWPNSLEKAEGLAILNDSTIAICNDNDYGQSSPTENGVAFSNNIATHMFVYGLKGNNKLQKFVPLKSLNNEGITGLSSSQSPYVLGVNPSVKLTSLLTAGDKVGGYMMAGNPDGLGAFDNGNGTFTLLANHEFVSTDGGLHAHGAKGAFVSKWIIDKNDLSVQSGSDLINKVKLWNSNANAYRDSSYSFGRFCAADLPAVSAFYNPKSGAGTQERIFMNGEESGDEGKVFAHIVTGTSAGISYELPALGKMSNENAVANFAAGDKTIVCISDDSTPGQVYIYVGNKSTTGLEIEKAGLTNGKLYGIAVNNYLAESNATIPAAATAFTLVEIPDAKTKTGAEINTFSNNNGVTTFLRPEDSAWDPSKPSDLYFNTTNSATSPSRLWKLHFNDINNPVSGGQITAVLDGTEGQKMLDNMTIDKFGHILLVEDVGNNAHIGKVWQYDIATDALKLVATHDSTRFLANGSNFITQDEEASGIIDIQEILGPGMFIIDDQAHNKVSGPQVEGGQFLVLYNPDSFRSNPEIKLNGNNKEVTSSDFNPSADDNTDFGAIDTMKTVSRSYFIENAGPGKLIVNAISFTGANASEFSLLTPLTFPITIDSAGNKALTVKFTPKQVGTRTATLTIESNDFNEGVYTVGLKGLGKAVNNVGINDGVNVSTDMQLYPNPSKDYINLSIDALKSELVSLHVIDLNGRLVVNRMDYRLNKGLNTLTLATSHLLNGTYIAIINSLNGVKQLKFIIQH